MKPLADVSPTEIANAWPSGDKYRIDGDLVRLNLLDSPLFDPEASIWDNNGFVAVKRSADAFYRGPDPKVAHLSLFGGGPGAALDRAVSHLASNGVEALVVGMDSGHFLPGLPVDLTAEAAWLESRGFQPGGLANDLERDLRDYRAPRPIPPAEYRRLHEGDELELDTFLVREFPGRWHYDVRRKIAAEGISTVFGLFVDGHCEGFALLQQDGCRLPIGGAVWRHSLGPSWGSLGPIGISKALRGQGLGDGLLAAALERLRDDGARQTIIDWTGLVDFYGAHGFTVTRQYRSYRLPLPSPRPSEG